MLCHHGQSTRRTRRRSTRTEYRGWSTFRPSARICGRVPGCFNVVATSLSDAVGQKVVYLPCQPREMRQHLFEANVSENIADQMLEMYDAIESGRMKSLRPRTAGITTTTTLAEFVHDTLVPQMAVSTAG
jgi:hypothetical protein